MVLKGNRVQAARVGLLEDEGIWKRRLLAQDQKIVKIHIDDRTLGRVEKDLNASALLVLGETFTP